MLMNSQTLFSIITVVYNAEDSIEKTLNSILNQTYDNYEVIIVDGSSTDRTMSIVSTFHFKKSRIVSEKDNGIYDAMNKGIIRCTGEYVYFLNAGDYFYSNNVLEKIDKIIRNEDSPGVVYGEVFGFQSDIEKRMKIPRSLDKYTFTRRTICHQAVFAKKSLFELYGNFDTRYKIVADQLWLSDMYLKHGVKFFYVDYPICMYSLEGVSSSTNYSLEKYLSLRQNYSLSQLMLKRYLPRFIKRIKKFKILGRAD